MAKIGTQKNQIGESGGEKKKNPSANPETWVSFQSLIWHLLSMVKPSIAIMDTLENWVLKWMNNFLRRFIVYCVLLYHRIAMQVAIHSPKQMLLA